MHSARLVRSSANHENRNQISVDRGYNWCCCGTFDWRTDRVDHVAVASGPKESVLLKRYVQRSLAGPLETKGLLDECCSYICCNGLGRGCWFLERSGGDSPSIA